MPADDQGYEQGLSNLALDKASFLEKIQAVRVWLQVTANRLPKTKPLTNLLVYPHFSSKQMGWYYTSLHITHL